MSWSTLSSFRFASATYWILPSLFLSSKVNKPVFSQFLNQLGASSYFALDRVLIRLVLANTATAGAVVYSIAINRSAQPAEIRASFTRGTVKKRTIT